MVVKRLSAIEDLGDIEVLCSDKTGTLTENKLSLAGIFSPDKEKCLLYGLLSSTQSPFDTALFKKISPEIKKEGREGKRVLAVAFKEFKKLEYSIKEEKDLKFLGYFSYVDPLKKTAKEAVELAKKLGVQIKIITGDSPEVAGAIGKETGLIKTQNEVILGEKIESLNEEDFGKTCQEFQVFARVLPKTKFKIVKSLQRKFEVGFLGEGINDAPALKIANVAIAISKGADISREVSDIILLKKDLRVIVDGINEGRNIFSNINKYIKCTLVSNFGNFYSIAAISLFIPFLPMLPIQILLVNLLSDFPLITVATDKVDIEELRKPKFYQLNQIILLIVFLGLVSTIFDFLFFGIFYKAGASLLQTLWFIGSILTEIVLIFSIRSRHFFLKAKSPSASLLFFSLLAILITLTLPFTNFGRNLFHFVVPQTSALLTVLALIISYFIVSEIVKLIYFHTLSNTRR